MPRLQHDPVLVVVPFKAMDSSIFQPNPVNNHHHKATTATNNNDDYQVGDPDLTNMIDRDLNFMKETMTEIQKFVDHMNVQINQACEKFEELKTRGGSDTNELDLLKMSVKKLKSQIPSKLKIRYDDDSKPHRKPWFDGSINSSSSNYQVDVNKAGNFYSLRNQPQFDHTTAPEVIQVSVLSFPPKPQEFLKFFGIFPEMATIKKRFMIYWWIGRENLYDFVMWRTAEDTVNEILAELTAKGFIEPIYKNCGLVVDSYRMPPYIRSALTIESEWFGFDYFPARCLTCWNRCIFNIDAAIIDGRHEIIFKIGTDFEVAYLGRGQSSVTHHIEIPDIKIFNALKNMKQLRFLSLRGISLITELPQFISQLTELQILDLKACHNLEGYGLIIFGQDLKKGWLTELFFVVQFGRLRKVHSTNTTPSVSSSLDYFKGKSSPRLATTTVASTSTTTAVVPTTTTNNNDYHGGASALANMIDRDLISMKEDMAKIQKYIDHMNVQINQACEKFEDLKQEEGVILMNLAD
ncbi:unnamed protein product [Camellia sinensis]